jgi:hypothetical protein
VTNILGLLTKEALEVIESRIKGGRWWTSIAIFLVLVTIIVTCLAIIERIVAPVVLAIWNLVTGNPAHIHVAFGAFAVWVLTVLVFLGLFYAFYRSTTKHLIENLDDSIELLQAFKVVDERSKQNRDLIGKLTAAVQKLVDREKVKE